MWFFTDISNHIIPKVIAKLLTPRAERGASGIKNARKYAPSAQSLG